MCVWEKLTISHVTEERKYDETMLSVLFKATSAKHERELRKATGLTCHHALRHAEWDRLFRTSCVRTIFKNVDDEGDEEENVKATRVDLPKQVNWMLFKKLHPSDKGFFLLGEDGTDQPRFCSLLHGHN